jgi:hypothetical protein
MRPGLNILGICDFLRHLNNAVKRCIEIFCEEKGERRSLPGQADRQQVGGQGREERLTDEELRIANFELRTSARFHVSKSFFKKFAIRNCRS